MRRAKATTRRRRAEMRPADPGCQGKSDGQRDQPRPEAPRGQARAASSRAECSDKAVKDKLHHQRLKDEQEDKQSEQLGKDFGGHESSF